MITINNDYTNGSTKTVSKPLNTLQLASINKDIQKEKELDVIHKNRYIDSKEDLTNKVEAKVFAKSLENLEISTDFSMLAKKAQIDIEDRKKVVPFINRAFTSFVQLAPRSLCLILGETGQGKSTITAAIASEIIKADKKILIISNEETAQDYALRLICLCNNYNIHMYKSEVPGESYTEEVKYRITNEINELAGKVDIIGLDYRDDARIVTTIEGVKAILTSATNKYDAILIDYYQNVSSSLNNINLNNHEAQNAFAVILDQMKHKVGAPIILLAQAKPGKEDYKTRIVGRKSIAEKCTDIYEIVRNYEDNYSSISCKKDRWVGNKGKQVKYNYENGKIVKYVDPLLSLTTEIAASKGEE